MIFPNVEDAHNIFDLREMAKWRLPKWLFEFIDRGTEKEVALRNNREAFERIKLGPRMLVDVSGRKLDTTLYGKEYKIPIGIAAGMMWYQGGLALARAGLWISIAAKSTAPWHRFPATGHPRSGPQHVILPHDRIAV